MKKHRLPFTRSRHVLAACFIAGHTVAFSADVIVQSRLSGGMLTDCPDYCEVAGNWANSTAQSGAPGVMLGVGSRFSTADNASFSVAPLLPPHAICAVDVTHGTASNIPTNLLVSVTLSGASGLDFSSPWPEVTDGFQQARGSNQWYRIGHIHVGDTNRPTLTFTRLSGDAGRFYADAVRFSVGCPPPPGSLHAALDGTCLVLNWSGPFQLQCATNLTGPFDDVAGVIHSPFTNSLTSGQARFFRLRQ
jgi:hypothetical protein